MDLVARAPLTSVHYWASENEDVQPFSFSLPWLHSAGLSVVQKIKNSTQKDNLIVALLFPGNSFYDLLLRWHILYTQISDLTLVTLNWQTDDVQMVAFKSALAKCSTVVFEKDRCERNLSRDISGPFGVNSSITQFVSSLGKNLPDCTMVGLPPVSPELLNNVPEEAPASDVNPIDNDTSSDLDGSERLIVFTSGTTAKPKGVALSLRNLSTGGKCLDQQLSIQSSTDVTVVNINCFHHINSSVVINWTLQRMKDARVSGRTDLHVIERYTSQFWRILCEIVENVTTSKDDFRVVIPMAPRHIDYLDALASSGQLESNIVKAKRFSSVLSDPRIVFLVGSSPVGPSTVSCMDRIFDSKKLPLVRFGSTETALQVLGVPWSLSAKTNRHLFHLGWNHTWQGLEEKGFLLGSNFKDLTDVKVVHSINPTDENFLVEVKEGEPGLIVCSGQNIFLRYLSDRPDVTRNSVVYEKNSEDVAEWYLGLGDRGFFLYEEQPECEAENSSEKQILNGDKRRKWFYWQSRTSGLLIRGGVNYSCEAQGEAWRVFLVKTVNCCEADLHVACCGMKVGSDHEDSLCLLIEVTDALRRDISADKLKSLCTSMSIDELKKQQPTISIAARIVEVGVIPRNFKGAPNLPELQKFWQGVIDAMEK